MKNLEKYFSIFWLKCIFRIVASELLLTAFFLFFGNSFNAKLWSEEERQWYAVMSAIQIFLNILWVYYESDYRIARDKQIMADIEKSKSVVNEAGVLVK